MAASDPATGVATPTGVLQGCAAFSYSGGTWSPAGAGPSVATLTGVLKGIAPFTYSGGWMPTGLSVPDVATPTGVLEGVAVYTWSGSAWTPASGSSTPTGALRGVAAFQWDGTAWQPAGQAGPTVATPYGVLDGVAMFNWSGSAWVAASAGPPGVTLDLSFMTGTLPTAVTFTRASTATYFDNTGTMQTAATNVARFDYNPSTRALNGLLIEEARTNGATQSADFTAFSNVGCTVTRPAGTGAPDGTALNLITEDTSTGSHSFYGTGNINMTAVPWTASVYIRAGTQRYISLRGEVYASNSWPWITFDTQALSINASAGVTTSGFVALLGGTFRLWLTWTPQGSSTGNIVVAGCNTAAAPAISVATGASYVGSSQTWYAWGLQAEAGAFPTSYIPTTGAVATRAADVATITSIPGRNATAESYAADYMFPTAQNSNNRLIASATALIAPLYNNGSNQAGTYDGVALLSTANAATVGAVAKAASTWTSPGNAGICLNGGTVVTTTTLTTGFAAISTFKLLGDTVTTDQTNGYIRRFRYWPRVLTNTEMQQVTT